LSIGTSIDGIPQHHVLPLVEAGYIGKEDRD
jgi:hypothetical protein